MIALHNQKNISKSKEPKKKMLNKKRRNSNIIEESNEILDETHNINQRKIHKKDNSKVKKEQNKFPKRWKGGIRRRSLNVLRRRNNSKLSPKKEKFINITKEINKPNTKGSTINEENEESASSNNTRVINLKEENIKKKMKDIFTFLNNKINILGKNMKKRKEEKNELNKKIYLLPEIYKESEIYIKKLGKNILIQKVNLIKY